jgi:hypothetical protein
MINPKGNGRVLQIFHPADGHEVYRNEGKLCITLYILPTFSYPEFMCPKGKYPYRGEFFSVFSLLRERRPDVFGETKGLLQEDGERWYEIRSKVQQVIFKIPSSFFKNQLTWSHEIHFARKI